MKKKRIDPPIKGYSDEYRWLSNFHYVDIKWRGKIWPTVEHAFQAAKFKDKKLREQIRLCESPGKAKRLAKKFKDQGHQRPDWYDIREAVMFKLNRIKFKHYGLRENLKDTGDAYLEETNHWHDQDWGNCKCGRPQCLPKGQNILGKTHMRIRRICQKEDGWQRPKAA
jgi:ribA/ribD-fused uncharacterized protein